MNGVSRWVPIGSIPFRQQPTSQLPQVLMPKGRGLNGKRRLSTRKGAAPAAATSSLAGWYPSAASSEKVRYKRRKWTRRKAQWGEKYYKNVLKHNLGIHIVFPPSCSLLTGSRNVCNIILFLRVLVWVCELYWKCNWIYYNCSDWSMFLFLWFSRAQSDELGFFHFVNSWTMIRKGT